MAGITTPTDLDYLLPELRLRLGDIDETAYRYLDEWLRVALVSSLKALQRWWRSRYLIDDSYVVTRSETGTFTVDAPPVIQQKDETPILIMATILTKTGVLQNNSWTVGSWRDAEIAVSNIEGGRMKEASLKWDLEELMWYLRPPTKSLMGMFRSDIPGSEEY